MRGRLRPIVLASGWDWDLFVELLSTPDELEGQWDRPPG